MVLVCFQINQFNPDIKQPWCNRSWRISKYPEVHNSKNSHRNVKYKLYSSKSESLEIEIPFLPKVCEILVCSLVSSGQMHQEWVGIMLAIYSRLLSRSKLILLQIQTAPCLFCTLGSPGLESSSSLDLLCELCNGVITIAICSFHKSRMKLTTWTS